MRYTAIWTYGQQCQSKGEVARAEGNTREEFAAALCRVYQNDLGDGFSCDGWGSLQAVRDSFGDDLPDWATSATYPVVEFRSNFGTEILQNPTSTDIIRQVMSEGYGDYDLTVTGMA